MMGFLKRNSAFIKRYFPNYTGYILRYGFARISPNYRTHAEFYSDREFFDELKKGKSIIRLGDGEAGLLHGRDIHYQKHSKDLENDLKKIIRNYTSDSSYVLGIPLFVGYSNKRLRYMGVGVLNCWLPLKVTYNELFNKDVVYIDPHFTYYKNKMIRFYQEFVFGKKVVIITNKKEIEILNKKQKQENLFQELHLIECPEEDAYSRKESLYKEIMEMEAKVKPDIILLAVGPLSKVIVYELSQKHICSYDVGFGLRYLWEGEDFSYKI